MDKKITMKNSILFNQLWIKQTIEDGNSHVLVSKKFENCCIGEMIELRYSMENLGPGGPKVTRGNSILYTREWIEKYHEEGLPLPKGRFSTQSVEKGLELQYYKMNLGKKSSKSQTEKLLVLSGERK